ncbi:MAG TPA: carbon-nitrogen hydrolase family protein [Trebonia sp.]|nr:carbon-nitrogen hydrolase family protein [Trebonia sp.]
MAVVKVATCQFPVSADVDVNRRHILGQLDEAAQRGARVAHFPEAALSGYAGVDHGGFAGWGTPQWARLREATREIVARCARQGIWTVLGSAHQLSDGRKPHNCLYVISDHGEVVDRYDKRFCAGDAAGTTGDLAHYSPGDHPVTWEIDSVRCGALICYDYRFPELYRQYVDLGVQLVFHSFHAGGVPAEQVALIGAAIGAGLDGVNPAATLTYPGITMPAGMTAAAASNFIWISCPNTSAPESLWPAFMVRADGVTTGRLTRNEPGLLLTTVDTAAPLYDSTAAWRQRAISGVLHSGTAVTGDPRSADRTAL